MPYFTTKAGISLYYKDWGTGQPVVFSHGWPLSADAWDSQMLYLGQHGYRVIAHDRRGHGRSEQTWDGNDMSTYADDLAELIEHLDLNDTVMIGHSTGGGEVARYIGRHGSKRVAKVVLIGAVPPLMLKSETNPDGTPMEVFDGIRAGVAGDRAQLMKYFPFPFYGYNRPGAKVSQGVMESFWQQGMIAGIKGLYDCVKAFSETDFHADLSAMDVPTLVMQGDDDQIVPFATAGALQAKLIPGATLKVYPGAPHGLTATHAELVNPDLLAFIRS